MTGITGTVTLPADARVKEAQLVVPSATTRVELSAQNDRLLTALLRDRGRVVGNAELLECLATPGNDISAVHTALYRIRAVLNDKGFTGPESVRGRGYRLPLATLPEFEHTHEYICSHCGESLLA